MSPLFSRQTWCGSCSGTSPAALCSRRHACMLHLSSAPPCAAHTLVGQQGTSRGIQQRSGTTQYNKPPILPAVYIYSGRVSFSELRTETRLVQKAWHGQDMPRLRNCIQLSPAPQSTQAVPPVTLEYLPAQHRHPSVDRHEAVRVAVLHQLPSAATRHARMTHHTFGID
jgi:hypothetical protein